MIEYQRLNHEQAQREQASLCQVLANCVAEGASVGFTDAADLASMRRFWQGVIADIASGEKQLLVARKQGKIIGTVTVAIGMMPNGTHRAEIAKLLVNPDIRRQGVAYQLMKKAEIIALEAGKTLLVLDTRSGDIAEKLYVSLGWIVAGQIPGYARSTEGVLDATTIMYKWIK
ncbi:acetyltransferase [[Pantoea] beijingensis]|uniref:Acetyltransferase n=1 Tax=[Pantoea] beijingensis TaxID=1324864 RepID=A0A443IDC1_9GAMM|nr:MULTISPECIES: GNAT family N-acetyltransferase [Erwiniaceae]RWR02119.1 acetyltransferase [[Pantoea] beijingensis]